MSRFVKNANFTNVLLFIQNIENIGDDCLGLIFSSLDIFSLENLSEISENFKKIAYKTVGRNEYSYKELYDKKQSWDFISKSVRKLKEIKLSHWDTRPLNLLDKFQQISVRKISVIV